MFGYLIFFCFIKFFSASRYNLYQQIANTKQGKVKTISVQNAEDYIDFVKNNDYVISYFYQNDIDECHEFLPILDQASKYKILNKKWTFLKIDCYKNSDVCSYLGMEQQPMHEIYRKSDLVNVELPTELIPLLELLYKISTEPIIKIDSKEDFFKKYGYYSPIIEIDKIEEKNKTKKDNNNTEEINDFMECIEKLANNEFVSEFYFGVIESKDYKDKIVFDNNNYPVTYKWDGICDNAKMFLKENKYPLMSKVDKFLLKKLDYDYKTLVTLVTYPNNTKINYLIFSLFTKLAYEHREYIFGYADYEEDKDLFKRYFELDLNQTKTEIQLVINNFNDRSYYMQQPVYNVENQTEKEIINEITTLVLNMSSLDFETDSRFQDLINWLGLNNMTLFKEIIIIILLIGILALLIYFCGNENDMDDDYYEYEEVSTDEKKNN